MVAPQLVRVALVGRLWMVTATRVSHAAACPPTRSAVSEQGCHFQAPHAAAEVAAVQWDLGPETNKNSIIH